MTKDECAALRVMAEEWARRAEGMRDQARRARARAKGSTWDQSCEIQAKKLEGFRDLCYGLSMKYAPVTTDEFEQLRYEPPEADPCNWPENIR